MLKNYFKIAIRNLYKHKAYGFINIAGLTIGLTCCLAIFQYVTHEYSFDRFNENRDNIYRVIQTLPLKGESSTEGGAFTGYGFGPAIAESVPEILRVARLHPEYDAAILSATAFPDNIFEEEKIFYVDSSFVKMFSFPLIEGNIQGALGTGTMLLSQSAAQKYFGAGNPIGQEMKVVGQIDRTYRITGIFKDVPSNSHLQFDFLLPIVDLIREGYKDEEEGGWSWNNFATYIQLRENADVKSVEQKLKEVFKSRKGDMLKRQGRSVYVWTQPLRDIHLNTKIDGPIEVTGSYRSVYFFSVIGLLTLLIALVNYINLETARALDRSREVGVRKVVGAERRQLVIQFLCESAMMNFIAAVLSTVLVETITPFLRDLAGVQLPGIFNMDLWFWGIFILAILIVTLISGLYPAFVLSSFKPITALKGKTGSISVRLWMRRGLVIFQFAASVLLIGGTIVVYNQLSYMRRMDLGLNLEQVLAITGPRVLQDNSKNTSSIEPFLQELKKLPEIHKVAVSTSIPGRGFNWNGASIRKAEDDVENTLTGVVTYIDTSFAQLYGMELIAGKQFNNSSAADNGYVPQEVIANETAIKNLGYASPSEALNQVIIIGGYKVMIIGVYKDFNWSSAHIPLQNIFFGRNEGARYISLRISISDLPETIAGIEEIYTNMFPGNVFRYEFVDETFNKQYINEERFAKLFTLFAALAILIACLGLFGLAAFTIRTRTKEIGVRKVLGASVPGIVGLLSRDFLILVIAAIIIASPVVYLLMNNWLESFAYRITIGPVTFIITGILVLLIAVITVSYQSIKAATVNPVNSLKYE